jgi:hypothetical protein
VRRPELETDYLGCSLLYILVSHLLDMPIY